MIKLVFAGLDAAGKTSILLSIKNKFSSLTKLTPTKGRVRQKLDYLGSRLLGWDLGGQDVYREEYLERPELFFSETDLLFFIVDAQDTERYAESLEYFENILKVLKKLDEQPKIVVGFHKMDPDIREDSKVLDAVSKLRADFTRVVDEHEVSILIQKTSIFDRSTIERMFSKGFSAISSVTGVLEKILESFYHTTKTTAVALIDSQGLVLASYAEVPNDEEMIVQTALLLQTLFKFHHDMGFEERDAFQLDYANSSFIMSKVKQIKDRVYYVWVVTKNVEAALENLAAFKEDLFPLVGFYM